MLNRPYLQVYKPKQLYMLQNFLFVCDVDVLAVLVNMRSARFKMEKIDLE